MRLRNFDLLPLLIGRCHQFANTHIFSIVSKYYPGALSQRLACARRFDTTTNNKVAFEPEDDGKLQARRKKEEKGRGGESELRKAESCGEQGRRTAETPGASTKATTGPTRTFPTMTT